MRRLTMVVVLMGISVPASAMYDTHSGRFLQHDPVGYADGLSLLEYVKSQPTCRVDPMGLAFYAVDGTWAKESDTTNPWWLYKETSESPREYWHGPGFTFGIKDPKKGAIGNDCKKLMYKVKDQICEDFCAAKKTGTAFEINMTGWSRGAVIVMGVAEALNDKGCYCRRRIPCFWKHYKPVGVNWIGLFDAVEMIHDPLIGISPIPIEILPGDNGWPNSVPSNVRNFAHAMKSGKNWKFPTVSYGVNEQTFWRYDGTPTSHGDIGRSKALGNNDAYEWIKQEAINAGVAF